MRASDLPWGVRQNIPSFRIVSDGASAPPFLEPENANGRCSLDRTGPSASHAGCARKGNKGVDPTSTFTSTSACAEWLDACSRLSSRSALALASVASSSCDATRRALPSHCYHSAHLRGPAPIWRCGVHPLLQVRFLNREIRRLFIGHLAACSIIAASSVYSGRRHCLELRACIGRLAPQSCDERIRPVQLIRQLVDLNRQRLQDAPH